jgi:SAM-dependent methyltransferase
MRSTEIHSDNPSFIPFELEALRGAKNYRDAILEAFTPFLGSKVLEVGGGMGHFSEKLKLVEGVDELTIVEPYKQCRNIIESMHLGVEIVDGTVADVEKKEAFASIININVLEHIEHDADELRRYYELLNPGGYLCLYVPARMELYSRIDQDFGHYRRYSRRDLTLILEDIGFEMVSINYVNIIGYFLWWINFKLFHRRTISSHQVKFHDRWIFPLTRLLEKLFGFPLFGQSVSAVARKPLLV